ncbi:hypothetical protein K435DRAFT_234037 [Dendrothele bispora CBS 962.96]|uniref:Uncharacterized protein n=1 Tax=Dendrothele bispora (strain CBS 962.96) TaxID=1314807 RepID=A0A4S8LR37_DENBC|nr:hypothetical protein K435DRAFT_234037 [Dendrothele bispora CBS 962.96]
MTPRTNQLIIACQNNESILSLPLLFFFSLPVLSIGVALFLLPFHMFRNFFLFLTSIIPMTSSFLFLFNVIIIRLLLFPMGLFSRSGSRFLPPHF